jgi:hypothetical protein
VTFVLTAVAAFSMGFGSLPSTYTTPRLCRCGCAHRAPAWAWR